MARRPRWTDALLSIEVESRDCLAHFSSPFRPSSSSSSPSISIHSSIHRAMADPLPPTQPAEASTSSFTTATTNPPNRSPTPPGGFHSYKPVLASEDFLSSTETNLARPLTDATITVRVIKSFPYRSVKNLVLNHIDLTTMTVRELEERCRNGEREREREKDVPPGSYASL